MMFWLVWDDTRATMFDLFGFEYGWRPKDVMDVSLGDLSGTFNALMNRKEREREAVENATE
jgi:hypothetical protein